MSGATLSRDAKVVESAAHSILSAADFDQLIDLAGSAQIVLIGEASHGTHDFYATRAELSRNLMAKRGFRLVALEADWPDTLRRQWVLRFLKMRSSLCRRSRQRTRSLRGAQRFSSFPCLDVAQHRDGGIHRMAARLEFAAGPRR